MTQYMLSVHSGPGGDGDVGEPMTDAQRQQVTQQIMALQAEMKAAGAWVFGGRLTEPDTATVVSLSAGQVQTTDGPFVESKEHLGGLYIIEAADLDAAIEWAARTIAIIGVPLEVRPFWPEPAA
jgi:hypothetical protein